MDIIVLAGDKIFRNHVFDFYSFSETRALYNKIVILAIFLGYK